MIEVAPLKGSLKIYAGRIMIENMMDLPFSPYMTLTIGSQDDHPVLQPCARLGPLPVRCSIP
ncbi:hypothetical protein [Stenotrophomonas phage CM2]